MHSGGHLNIFCVAAGKQDGQFRANHARLRGQFAAIHDRQTDVGHHQIDVLIFIIEKFQRLLASVRLQNLEFQLLQHIDDQHAHNVVVFNDQDDGLFSGHIGGSQQLNSQ
ncbi:hypothetical protein D9M70_628610 [compost metagenome]